MGGTKTKERDSLIGRDAGGRRVATVGGKGGELTYIGSSLALRVLVQAARPAVAAPLLVLAVVPRRGMVGARGGRRRAGAFPFVHLVFGIGPGRVRRPR